MFDWLGTFVREQFEIFTTFLENMDGARPSITERLKHLEAEKGRNLVFLKGLLSIDARRKAGTLSRWKEEPTFPDESYRPPPLYKDDAEAAMFIDAMRFVWRSFIWRHKDNSSFNVLKAKDRDWQFEEEIRDVKTNKTEWSNWKKHVKQMLSQANMRLKIYRNLLQKHDDPPAY